MTDKATAEAIAYFRDRKNFDGHWLMDVFGHGRNLADRVEELEREIADLRRRLLTAAGDDLCRLTQEEIKQFSDGTVKIPPKEEFLLSCERFHSQIANESGVMPDCMTLAQLIAENAKLQAALQAVRDAYEQDPARWMWRQDVIRKYVVPLTRGRES